MVPIVRKPRKKEESRANLYFWADLIGENSWVRNSDKCVSKNVQCLWKGGIGRASDVQSDVQVHMENVKCTFFCSEGHTGS